MRATVFIIPFVLVCLTQNGLAAERLQQPSFSFEQARQGENLYKSNCAICHENNMEGTFDTPALTGRFIRAWGGSSLSDLHHYIQRAMPQMAPGILSSKDVSALIAFILEKNGLPAGKKELPSSEQALQNKLMPKSIVTIK